MWIWVVLVWCKITRTDAVWIKTNNLDKVVWLRIARHSHDPWKEELRLCVTLRVGPQALCFFLNDDGHLSERTTETAKDGRTVFKERKYEDRWMYVSPSKRTEHILRNT